ncbi:glycosyltransferase [Epilithonimonas sp.]|uniref:glycosyltransferase family 2 protein n=1 Tax=Epilithonimonas sp. TaxID=2894511 RepID=UPI0028A0B597|nr:glycosyltransferase [Epilithonimonas sp.]
MENPLVSIIVITYNSSKYVLETLESARAQTYQNIELIISDDGSKDATVEICRDWLKENSDRFVHSQLITVEQNTGIPANCNRGVKASKGEWIKLIAGDDVFTDNAFANFVHASQKTSSLIIQTNAMIFNENFNEKNLIGKFITRSFPKFFTLEPAKQNRLLLTHVYLNAPAVFFNRQVFESLKFDEDFPMIEDYPFWVKATMLGLKIDYLEVTTVKYRIHSNSVQTLDKNVYQNFKKRSKTTFAIKNKLYGERYNFIYRTFDKIRLESLRNKFSAKLVNTTDFFIKKLLLYIA